MCRSLLFPAVACALALSAGDALAQQEVRSGVGASPAALREADLKHRYLRCSDDAIRGVLARGEIALCSVVYESLLEEVFRGDFLALIDWSRNQPVAASAVSALEKRPGEPQRR